MGRQPNQQEKLFYNRINLDQRIRTDHILRQISQHIDFDFIYKEVRDTYGANGNVSVPPPVILKMLLLLILYNVRSERELLSTLPERLDWLWFLGFDLDDEVPNHSVLSKARTRWGSEAFKRFFERIVWQCVQAGLVDGRKLFMDGCLIQANASNNSVVNTESLKRYLNKSYQKLEARLDEPEASDDEQQPPRPGPTNRTHISTTDPDASVVRQGGSRSKLKYQVHRAVDGRSEVITATEVTTGSVNEAHRMDSLLDAHGKNTELSAEVCVADQKYGTIENYLSCHDRGVKSHFASFEQAHRGSGCQEGIFPKEAFDYEAATDSFRCPAGEQLTRRRFNARRQQWEYTASAKTCQGCALRAQCTRSHAGRSLKRHLRQEALDTMLSQAESDPARRDRKTRQHLMERSFARGTRYGLKQARWRRLWRVEIQEYLTATVQNVMVLIRCLKEQLASAAKAEARKAQMPGAKQLSYRQMPNQNTVMLFVRHPLALRWSTCSWNTAIAQLL
jgi:transposase